MGKRMERTQRNSIMCGCGDWAEDGAGCLLVRWLPVWDLLWNSLLGMVWGWSRRNGWGEMKQDQQIVDNYWSWLREVHDLVLNTFVNFQTFTRLNKKGCSSYLRIPAESTPFYLRIPKSRLFDFPVALFLSQSLYGRGPGRVPAISMDGHFCSKGQ